MTTAGRNGTTRSRRLVALETPKGNPVRFACRPDTNDEQIVRAVVSRDEYQLAGRNLDGWAIDIGAHIGSVTIALAIDFPVSVVAVEPVPENRVLIGENALLNKAAGVVLDGRAAGAAATVTVIEYGYAEDPTYRYIGGMHGTDKAPAAGATVEAVSLSGLLDWYGIAEVAFLKIDCEGCEWAFLADPAIVSVREIAGEIHRGDGPDEFDRITDMLSATHDVDVDRDRYLFQAFRR